MKIAIAGAGPAGLYFALLMKKAWPTHSVAVFEQNSRDATYGFGVVFSNAALTHLESTDDDFYTALSEAAEHWNDLTIVHKGDVINIDGNGFSAISRLGLLQILFRLCDEAGVELHFGSRVSLPEISKDADLVVGADGLNSAIREELADQFKPHVTDLTNRFIWYGTCIPFKTLSLTFDTHDNGSYVAHHYRYAPEMSTFIVECDAQTFDRAGFAQMSEKQSRNLCEKIFSKTLDGHKLISNNSTWRQFPVLANTNWTAGNVVLIGDALRTIHFSIGSGTRLAMEDAVALYRSFRDTQKTSEMEATHVVKALENFVATRTPQVSKLLDAARGSYEWYEKFADRMGLSPYELAYDYMTRSGRMSDARLREIAPRFHANWHEYEKEK